MAGPLDGLRVVELAGLGPGPHAAMQLADLGADVLSVVRPARPPLGSGFASVSDAGDARRTVEIDLKSEDGLATALDLTDEADVLIEGYRPGVAERLGLGPHVCCRRNPTLVYGRVTGWGQDGPLAGSAGRDINYLGLTGVLHAIGRPGEPPAPPLNLVGDFGGGSMLLLTGILAALFERQTSGRGQVVDAAMVDGIGQLARMVWALRSGGFWNDDRSHNLLDGGAPFYGTYACADGAYVAVGAIEPQFYAALLDGLEFDAAEVADQWDRTRWASTRQLFAARFATRPRDEWTAIFSSTDACVTPVLTFAEAPQHPHAQGRGSFAQADGATIPAPAPRFSRSTPPRQ